MHQPVERGAPMEGEVVVKQDYVQDGYEDCDEFDLASGGSGSPKAATDSPPTSKETIDRSFAAKMYIEQYYGNLSKAVKERGDRRLELEKKMELLRLTNREQNDMRRELDKKETEFMRFKRKKMSPKEFDTIKIIGRGAFGEVRLVTKKNSEEIYAMKKLRKDEMLKKEQVAHVRAERDVLVHANNEWVVKLYYSFQDESYLYLIMEYLPGGDMMSLLIKYDIFTEEQTRFCIAETLLAIESVHALGFVHRDVKPDNLLLDEDGHVKLTDFGLCTGFHRMHSSAFYQKLVGDAMTLKRQMLAETPLTERIASFKRSRRALAFSAVGTPDYTAPEVFLQVGYGMECDWWSLGVIMFEMLVGYPPFLSDNSTETCMKIINCKETLRFPEDAQISHDAQDLIEQLVCERSVRLSTPETIKAHPFFKGVNWETIRQSPAPFVPNLSSPIDTSNFEEYEELPETAPAPPHPKESRPTKKVTHTDKDLPFIGYTYKGFDAGGRRSSNGAARRPTMEHVFSDKDHPRKDSSPSPT